MQLAIRLLVPAGSYLLQRDLQALVAQSEKENLSRREVFAAIWRVAHEAAERPVEQQLQSF